MTSTTTTVGETPTGTHPMVQSPNPRVLLSEDAKGAALHLGKPQVSFKLYQHTLPKTLKAAIEGHQPVMKY